MISTTLWRYISILLLFGSHKSAFDVDQRNPANYKQLDVICFGESYDRGVGMITNHEILSFYFSTHTRVLAGDLINK